MTNHREHLHRLNSVAVHLALLRTGKVIAFSGDHEKIWNWTKGESSLWDPQNPDARDDPRLKRNLFCSGHCFLPDGRLLVAGGQSTYNHPVTIVLSVFGILQLALIIVGKKAADHDIHTFDPVEQKWTFHTQMPKARWYPTCITLPDGKALIISGTSSHAHHSLFGGFMNSDYEIFDPQTNTLSTSTKFIDEIGMYPFLQILPGGTLFVHSKNTTKLWNISDKKFLPNEQTPKVFHTNVIGTRTYPGMGSCVLLPLKPDSETAKILVVGGSTSLSPDNNTAATTFAEIFTVNLNNPVDSQGWKKVSSQHTQRILCDSILLPDGTILVTNGAAKGVADDNKDAVREIELFDPSNETWTVLDSKLQRDRLYHSTAVLLPDGRVLVAGSTGHNWVRAVFSPQRHFEHEIEIITPPYLYGNPTRPEINACTSTIRYDSSFEITCSTAQDVESVVLIRLSSTTHNNNMDQRYVILSIIDKRNNLLKVKSPKNGTYAPPGYYMLFLLNKKKVPSIAKFVKVD